MDEPAIVCSIKHATFVRKHPATMVLTRDEPRIHGGSLPREIIIPVALAKEKVRKGPYGLNMKIDGQTFVMSSEAKTAIAAWMLQPILSDPKTHPSNVVGQHAAILGIVALLVYGFILGMAVVGGGNLEPGLRIALLVGSCIGIALGAALILMRNRFILYLVGPLMIVLGFSNILVLLQYQALWSWHGLISVAILAVGGRSIEIAWADTRARGTPSFESILQSMKRA